MLNALSSHSKLGSTASTQRLSATAICSPSSTSGKMNLSAQKQATTIGHLSLSNSDSSSGGGSSLGHNNNNNNNLNIHSNNNNHRHSNNSNNNHSLNLSNFHHQQFQQQQQQLAGNQQVESIEANKGYTFEEQFKQLYELSDDPKRKEFLDDLFQFMADRNQPVNRIPIMAKQVLDLYELYNLVVARGGLVEVINKKIWREITKGLNLPSSITSAAFTLRTQYMKYLYPYECAKNNFSHQDELQQAIDGNRREGRRAGATSLAGYGPYLGSSGNGTEQAVAQLAGHYSASPSPNHLFGGHNLLSQAHQNQHQHQSQLQQHQPLQLHQDPREPPQRPRSSSSDESPNASFGNHHQRLYQDSIESDREEEGSIDLGHTSKRNSPIDHEHQHLDPHNHHLNQQQAAAAAAAAIEQQQQQFAAAAAALRQQLGAAINFAGTQNFLGQLSGQATQGAAAVAAAAAAAAANPNSTPNPNATNTAQVGGGVGGPDPTAAGDLFKQQQEQLLAALMVAANQQQQQQQATGATVNPDQQAAGRAALSTMATNAMLIAASNAPDAMAMAHAAQAIGVKGAFIILLL